ncbi:hypothetical protein ACIPC2_02345 [Curtobacterium pusillum]|uniref:hypothetical protein n=1 Tax=Curtobacterium pusillum TaxID=69373 RepID=UPI003822BED8
MRTTTRPDIDSAVSEYTDAVEAGLVHIADAVRRHATLDIAASAGLPSAEAEEAFERAVEARSSVVPIDVA